MSVDPFTGLLNWTDGDLNINIKQINTSEFTDTPCVFIKKSNTVISGIEYDNEVAKMTIDCMDSNWANIEKTIPIPNNNVLVKTTSGLQW